MAGIKPAVGEIEVCACVILDGQYYSVILVCHKKRLLKDTPTLLVRLFGFRLYVLSASRPLLCDGSGLPLLAKVLGFKVYRTIAFASQRCHRYRRFNTVKSPDRDSINTHAFAVVTRCPVSYEGMIVSLLPDLLRAHSAQRLFIIRMHFGSVVAVSQLLTPETYSQIPSLRTK